MRANQPHSEWQQQNPEPGCFIYSGTLSSNGASGEGWRECGKQTWLHPSAFQITGGGGGGGGGEEGGGVEGEGGVEGVSREKKCCVMDLLSTSPGCQEPQRWRDDASRSSEKKGKKKGRENWEVVWEQKKMENAESSEKRESERKEVSERSDNEVWKKCERDA